MALIAHRLFELRDAWVAASEALRDYHFSLESEERQLAAKQMLCLLERSRSRSQLSD